MSGTPSLPPGLAGRFTVERALASGGFGSVLLARQTALDRRVALKLLHEGILEDAEQVKRFLLEAKITASFDHAHIVRVIDHGEERGLPWIAYEFLEGCSLADLIASGRLTAAVALKACAQIASALEVAHAHGVLHRDIKAANVMESAPEHFKVTDFGIARWTGAERVKTKTGTILGTPSHIAPEVVLGGEPGPAADLYALGIVAFEALAGRLPFTSTSLPDLLGQHVKTPPPQLSACVPGISKNIEACVMELLEKDPARRPAKAGEVARRFEALAAEAGAVRSRPRRVTTGAKAVSARTTVGSRAEIGMPTVTADSPGSVRGRAGAIAAAAVAAVLLVAGGWAMRGGEATPVVVVTPSASPSVRSTEPPAQDRPAWNVFESMARIPGGPAIIGDDGHRDYRPRHPVKLSPYRIDRHEVSNREFRSFLRSRTGAAYLARRPATPRPPGGVEVQGKLRHDFPAVWVTKADAEAYCAWTGRSLPTEAQWERAGRGPEGRVYPWPGDRTLVTVVAEVGDDVTRARDQAGTLVQLTRVFSTPVDRSVAVDDVTPDGVKHLAGNVREYVADWFWAGYYEHCVTNKLDLEDPPGADPVRFPGKDISNALVKGASADSKLRPLYYRNDLAPQESAIDLGFRCACLETAVPK